MDIEEQTCLLSPTSDHLEAVKVFPLIPHIRKDAMVRAISGSELAGVVLNLSARSPSVRRKDCVQILVLTSVLWVM